MAAGGLIAAAGAAAAAAARRRRLMAIADQVWAPYAAARGMRYQPGREGWAHTELPRIDGVVGPIALALEVIDEEAAPSTFWAAALARPTLPLPGHVEVSREGVLSRIAKLFGAQDLVIGDEAFDRTYIVKATDESTARALLAPPVRNEMLALDVKYLAYDDGTENAHGAVIVAHVLFEVVDFDAIDRRLAFAVSLARARGDQGAYR